MSIAHTAVYNGILISKLFLPTVRKKNVLKTVYYNIVVHNFDLQEKTT